MTLRGWWRIRILEAMESSRFSAGVPGGTIGHLPIPPEPISSSPGEEPVCALWAGLGPHCPHPLA